MILVDQMYLRGNPEGIPGDCVRACVASILEMPIEEVPHFVQLADNEWAECMIDWCDKIGIMADWQDGIITTNVPVMVTGPSPRQGRHAVVFLKGKLIHDPHPSRLGLGERDTPTLNYFHTWTFDRNAN